MFLEKLIENKTNEITAIRSQIEKAETADEVRSLGAKIDALNKEIEEARAEMQRLADEQRAKESAFDPAKAQTVATVETKEARTEVENKTSTMEYREAFMNYVQRGVVADCLEKRVDASGVASDLDILIPQTVMQEIIKDVEKIYGTIYSKVRKLNVKGGVKFPIGSFSATFSRIAENGKSDRQSGGSITGYVEFSYLIGEIRLAQSLLQSVLSVPAFEAEIAKVIAEAYVKAMDTEILKGDASNGEMEGIFTSSRVSNVVTMSANDMADWKKWQKNFFAKIPLSMRNVAGEFVMNAGTYESNIKTLCDDANRPVYNETFNPVDGAEVAKFKGKNVQFVEGDLIGAFDDAESGDVVAMYWVPEKAYAINSNMEFTIMKYFDHETNQNVTKALVINDGKVLDPKYIWLIKKA